VDTPDTAVTTDDFKELEETTKELDELKELTDAEEDKIVVREPELVEETNGDK